MMGPAFGERRRAWAGLECCVVNTNITSAARGAALQAAQKQIEGDRAERHDGRQSRKASYDLAEKAAEFTSLASRFRIGRHEQWDAEADLVPRDAPLTLAEAG
jgi:hypothetical protein